MSVEAHQLTEILYDQDYQLWLETTIQQLRLGEFSEVDLENLIEELESMGRISQNLDYTFKKTLHAAEKENEEVQLKRGDFWEKIRDIKVEDLIFIDESL